MYDSSTNARDWFRIFHTWTWRSIWATGVPFREIIGWRRPDSSPINISALAGKTWRSESRQWGKRWLDCEFGPGTTPHDIMASKTTAPPHQTPQQVSQLLWYLSLHKHSSPALLVSDSLISGLQGVEDLSYIPCFICYYLDRLSTETWQVRIGQWSNKIPGVICATFSAGSRIFY